MFRDARTPHDLGVHERFRAAVFHLRTVNDFDVTARKEIEKPFALRFDRVIEAARTVPDLVVDHAPVFVPIHPVPPGRIDLDLEREVKGLVADRDRSGVFDFYIDLFMERDLDVTEIGGIELSVAVPNKVFHERVKGCTLLNRLSPS